MLNFGSEQVIETERGRFTLSRLRLRLVRQYRDWVAKQEGDLFATAERFAEKLPADRALELVREAEARKRELESFSVASPLAQKWLCTQEGLTRLVELLLAEHHPQATEDEVEAVTEEVARRLVEVIQQAVGALPNGAGPEASRAEPTGMPSTSAATTPAAGAAGG